MKTPEELKRLRTAIIKKHLSTIDDGTDGIKLNFAYHEAMEEYASQSKPQEIEWISSGEINKVANGRGINEGSAVAYGMSLAQQMLKTRIKPVDRKEIAKKALHDIFEIYKKDDGATHLSDLIFEYLNNFKPVDTKTVDAVDVLNWIVEYRTEVPEEFDSDKIRCFDGGWFWESDDEGDGQLTPQQIVDLYKQDIESKK